MGTVDEKKNTSTVVVALPAMNDPVHDFGPEQKHATLLWFGDIDDDADIQRMTAEVAARMSPIEVEAGELGQLGDDEPQAQVLHLNDESSYPAGLNDLRESLLGDENVRKLWEAIKQYPSYTPHVTLGYGDEVSDDDLDDVTSNVHSITFDRLAVWHRDEQTEYPLGYRKLESMVAGVKFVRTQQGAKRFGVPIGSQIRTGKDGKVTVLKKGNGTVPHPAAKKAVPPVDPHRTPTKFVATVPGQKAKIALANEGSSLDFMGDHGLNTKKSRAADVKIAQQAANKQARAQATAQKNAAAATPSAHASAPSKPSKPHMKPGSKSPSPSVSKHAAREALRQDRVNNLLGKTSQSQDALLKKVQTGGSMNSNERKRAEQLIQQMINKLKRRIAGNSHKSSSSSKSKSSASKSASSSAKKSSSKKSSTSHHSSSSSSSRYSSAAWLKDLQSVLSGLKHGGGGHSSGAGSAGSGGAKGTHTSSSSGAKKHFPRAFGSLTDKQLSSEIRSLVMSARHSDSAAQSLKLAKQEKKQREDAKARRERTTRLTQKRAGL